MNILLKGKVSIALAKMIFCCTINVFHLFLFSMTSDMDALANALVMGKIHENWAKRAYPSEHELGNWYVTSSEENLPVSSRNLRLARKIKEILVGSFFLVTGISEFRKWKDFRLKRLHR